MANILLLGNGINLIINDYLQSSKLIKKIRKEISKWKLEAENISPNYKENYSWETLVENLYSDISGAKNINKNADYKNKFKRLVKDVINQKCQNYPDLQFDPMSKKWENFVNDINEFFYSKINGEKQWPYRPEILTLNYESYFNDFLKRNCRKQVTNLKRDLEFIYVHGTFDTEWALFNDEKNIIAEKNLLSLKDKINNDSTNTLVIIGVKITNDTDTIKKIIDHLKITHIDYYWFSRIDWKNYKSFKEKYNEITIEPYNVIHKIWKNSL